jgi:hypothetical protein
MRQQLNNGLVWDSATIPAAWQHQGLVIARSWNCGMGDELTTSQSEANLSISCEYCDRNFQPAESVFSLRIIYHNLVTKILIAPN